MIKISITNNIKGNKISKEVVNIIKSKDFLEFLKDKCLKELNNITDSNITDLEYEIASQYKSENKADIGSNYVELYNYSMMDLSEVSEKTLANYPDGLSMAKLVEYGAGVVGKSSEGSKYAGEDNWGYDLNGHGTKGWYYKKDGNIYWSMGSEGKLIFHKLKDNIEDNIYSWITEYLKNNVGK